MTSSWINNTNITAYHLSAFKILVDYNPTIPKKSESTFLRSTYYDDSITTQIALNIFSSMFNSNNKFIDPFFNPLYSISSTYSLRISETNIVKLPRPYPASLYLGANSSVSFTIFNDLNVDLDMYWVNYGRWFSSKHINV